MDSNQWVLFESLNLFRRQAPEPDHVQISSGRLPLLIVRNVRARRYSLRLQRNGTARLTMPKRASSIEARRFVEKHLDWLERQYQRFKSMPAQSVSWRVGTKIWLRGELVEIVSEQPGLIRFGEHALVVQNDAEVDLRPLIEQHLRAVATDRLPKRLLELSSVHGLSVKRVSVRNQKSRWGSCSPTGTISLNWRLIQTPEFVRDYILLHELAHLRHLNHSRRFWDEVERICPDYLQAERWLKEQRGFLS